MSDKKLLSFDDIEKAPDVEYSTVEAWGGVLRLGSLSAGAMIEFVEANEGPAKRTAGLRLIIQSMVDESGKRIGDMSKIDVLRRKDAKTCNRIVDAILELNGLSKKAQVQEKNGSSEATTAASPTA